MIIVPNSIGNRNYTKELIDLLIIIARREHVLRIPQYKQQYPNMTFGVTYLGLADAAI